jgi:FlaA1/EpsC-like NDP-sugar epimerase
MKKKLGVLLARLPSHSGAVLFGAYTLFLMASLTVAYLMRFDFNIPSAYRETLCLVMPWVVMMELLCLYAAGQFSVLLGYFRTPDLFRIALALCMASCVLICEWYVSVFFELGWLVVSRSVILGNFILSLFLISGFRLALRILRERQYGITHGYSRIDRVAIAGAGDAGAQLAADMLARRSAMRMKPVVFIDDDKDKWNHHIHGIPVVGGPDMLDEIRLEYALNAVIIAMPSAPAKRIRDIVDIANDLRLKVHAVPSMEALATGVVTTSKVRPVQIEDLLGRKPVMLETDSIRDMIHGKVVMVTGAGGSIGSEIVAQVASHGPVAIVAVDHSEFAMFSLEERMKRLGKHGCVIPVVANIRDTERMRAVLAGHRPDILFHAAAYKHVPIMERQPDMAIVNNALGTADLAELAAEAGVGRFVLISTDKAVNPTSAMGASKRLAEIYIQALNDKPGNRTLFMAVRFGNVLNSSGSVVPIFQKQIEAGGPVTVTHPDVTRFFMTIPEAVGLVLQCGTIGQGGEIFVLNMGTPVKIVDMARQMIRLSGLKPDVDIDITFTGLRPGEKLYEELQRVDEHHVLTSHERIYRFTCEPEEYSKARADFAEIRSRLQTLHSANEGRSLIKTYVPEYMPYSEAQA